MELRCCDRWNVACVCRIETQRTIQERKIEDIITQKNSEHKSYVDVLESDYATYKVSSCTFSSLNFFSQILYMYVCECWLREKLYMTKKSRIIYGLMAVANNGFYDIDLLTCIFFCQTMLEVSSSSQGQNRGALDLGLIL